MTQSPFGAPFMPDWESFVQCVALKKEPSRAHMIELFLDAEVKDAICERYDLTVEAFQDYLSRLKPGGLLAVEQAETAGQVDVPFPDAGILFTFEPDPQYDIPLVHGGGNFHLFATGDAFMTSLILTENPGLSEQDVQDYFLDYQNVDVTIYPGFPTSYDSTRHIDMWMILLSDDDVIVSEFAHADPYYPGITVTEAAAAPQARPGDAEPDPEIRVGR